MIIIDGYLSNTICTHGFGAYYSLQEFMSATITLKKPTLNFSLVTPLNVSFSLSSFEGDIVIGAFDIEYETKAPYARLTMKYAQ